MTIEKQVQELIEPIINQHNYVIEKIEYVKEGKIYFLRVIIGKNGIIDLSESMSYEVLKSVEATSTVSNKVGLIQVSDYIVSSLDSTCLANIASSNCKNSNYMATLFGKNAVWTMDNSSSGKVITIENNIITNHTLNTTSDITYRIYPVFYLKRSASISSGNGTSSSPYIIK